MHHSQINKHMWKTTLYIVDRKCEKKILDQHLRLDPHFKLMGSILGCDPSLIQVSWKSVQEL